MQSKVAKLEDHHLKVEYIKIQTTFEDAKL